jgi:integrase
MSIYQRGKNWYVDFTFHGQRIREMIGPSRKGAEAVIAKRKAEIAENKFLDVRKELELIGFHEFAVKYISWSKANKKPLSYREDIYKMRRLEKEFGKQNIQDITTWRIEKWKSKRKEEVGPSCLNGELRLIKHMFSKAIEWGKGKENPAKMVKLLKGERQRVRFLSPEETQIFLSNCTDHLKSIAMVVLNTGLRKSEVLGLRRDQVNFEQGIITLIDTKNSERRDIPMNQTVQAVLKEIPYHGEFVFSDGNGRRFTSLQHSFERARKKSGIEDFHFHDLRHCFASNLVMAGVDIMTVKELLGHKTLAMTLRYSHLSPAHKTRAVNVLDRSLNPPQEEMLKKVVSISR